MAEYRNAEKKLDEAMDILRQMEREHAEMMEKLRGDEKDRLNEALLRQMEGEQRKLSSLRGEIAEQLDTAGKKKRETLR